MLVDPVDICEISSDAVKGNMPMIWYKKNLQDPIICILQWFLQAI